LNKMIQAAVNPANGSHNTAFGGDYEFRVRDRVLQTANDPARQIVNGDIGTIVEIYGKKDLIVEFDCGRVRCLGDQVGELKLAYAITVHKSQGSEWPHIVLVCDPMHSFMLRRQLAYTAITRTTDKLTLVGSKGSLMKACVSPLETDRRTGLRERIA